MASTVKIDDYRTAPDLVVHRAADILPTLANKDAKVAAVHASIELAKNNLAGTIEDAIVQAVTMHEMIEGDHASAGDPVAWLTGLSDAISGALPQMKETLGAEWDQVVTGIRADQPEMAGAMADAIADRIAAAWAPLPMHRGKFLSAAGIVAEHLEAISSGVPGDVVQYTYTAQTPLPEANWRPPPPASPSAPVTDGIAPPPAVSAPAQSSPLAELGAPGPEELKKAYMAWYHAAGPDAKQAAAKLGISEGTLRNWGTGRSTPKCDTQQAGTIIADIDARTAELGIARDIFVRCL